MAAVLGPLETVAYRHRSHAVPSNWPPIIFDKIKIILVMMTMMIIDQAALDALEPYQIDTSAAQ